ncbi:hypothetical protein [Micromonospora vulcania]|uniref:DUF916 domain-containing protein n=1 Tax=Micromonospora vulcania TaxID=1441873 RepID=A0ABW1GZW0_9ACTN
MFHIAGALLPVLLALPPTVPVDLAAPDQSDFSLTVSPNRMVVPPGEIGQPRQFTVTNKGPSAIDVSVRTASFVVDAEGDFVFRSDVPHTAIDWVAVRPERLRLAANSAEMVDLRIALPPTAEPGEHQVAVLFSTEPPADTPGMSVRRSVGAPVYVTVPGEAVDSVQVTELGVPGFTLGGPMALTATVRNAGTLHRDFVAADRLRAQVAGQDVTFDEFTLLRDASRRVSARWEDPPLACVCQVAVAVSNPDGSSGSARATVVILPLHLMGTAAGGLLLLVLLGWMLRRGRRGSAGAAEADPISADEERHALAAWFPGSQIRQPHVGPDWSARSVHAEPSSGSHDS